MNIKTLAAFIFGAAIGAVGSYFITKEALKKKTQLEINEMREYYKEHFLHVLLVYRALFGEEKFKELLEAIDKDMKKDGLNLKDYINMEEPK